MFTSIWISGEQLNTTKFEEWQSWGKAPAVPNMVKLFHEIRERGLKIFLVSSRKEYLRSATVENLIEAGYHSWSNLLLRYILLFIARLKLCPDPHINIWAITYIIRSFLNVILWTRIIAGEKRKRRRVWPNTKQMWGHGLQVLDTEFGEWWVHNGTASQVVQFPREPSSSLTPSTISLDQIILRIIF